MDKVEDTRLKFSRYTLEIAVQLPSCTRLRFSPSSAHYGTICLISGSSEALFTAKDCSAVRLVRFYLGNTIDITGQHDEHA